MSRGLLRELRSEAEIAAVLGHEIGHVTAEHVDERVTQAMGLELLGQIAGAYSEGAMAQMTQMVVGYGGQGYLLKFGRDQESEADALGLRYMIAGGYDPDGLIRVLEVLSKASQGGGAPPEILSTHPHPETRLERVNDLLEGPFKPATTDPTLKMFEGRFNRKAAPYLGSPTLASLGAVGPERWCSHCRRADTTSGGAND